MRTKEINFRTSIACYIGSIERQALKLMENMADNLILIIGVGVVLFLLIALLAKFVMEIYVPFVSERDYIKTEIARSYGDGREHWERELKRLYFGSIPLIGGYLVRKSVGNKKK